MDSKKDDTRDTDSSFANTSTTSNEASTSQFFIDDYSHLRLSYHRVQSSEETSDLSTSMQDTSIDTCETFETDLSDVIDERQKMREYYISQMPDLPHPALTVASIIANASRKMGSQFRYSDRIEQSGMDKNFEFTPKSRSTLNCKKLPQ